MINARLLALVPKARVYVIACVVARWLALLCQVAVFVWIGALAGALVGLDADAGTGSGVVAAVAAISGMSTDAHGLASAGLSAVLTWKAFAVPVACVVAFFLLTSLANWCADRAGSLAASRLSQLAFSRVVELGSARAGVMDDSRVTTLMGEGIEMLRPYVSKYVPQFVYALLAPLTLFFVVASFDLLAAVVLLVFVPLMPASIMVLMTKAKRRVGERWGTYVDLGATFLDAVRGLTVLKVFGTDGRMHQRLDAQAEDFRQATMALLRVQLQSVTFMDLFTYGGIAAGCVVACVQVGMGQLDAGAAMTIVLLSSGFFLPMRKFGSLFHTGMNANPVIEEVFTLMDARTPDAGTETIEGAQITIEAVGLSFSYDGGAVAQGDQAVVATFENDVTDTIGAAGTNDETCGGGEGPKGAVRRLDGVDIVIRPNSFIGITGPSGSGKSTFAALLAGDLGGYGGSLRINGVELRDVAADSIHDTVTLVSSESHVFRGTFRGNLALAAPGASDAQMWDVLRQARLADFVYASGGLDAPVEGGGANLSGGQRQRLVFARALLRNTPVYVFDEATANIDAESERFLLAAIQKIALSKTVIVISHRLPVLRHADEILVMCDGRVEERGTHESLIGAGGLYRSMWDRSAELEAFAASVIEDLPDENADAVEEALADMPGMMSGVMRAFMSIVEAERYQQVGSGEAPEGHPAWIPLPNYRPGMSRQDYAAGDEGPAGEEAPNGEAAMDKTAEAEVPSFMKLADATAEGADAEAIKAAMRKVRDHMQQPDQARVIVEPLPPAHRPAFTIVRKCLRLTEDMVPQLALAVLLGAVGWLLSCAVFMFAIEGAMAALGGGGEAGAFLPLAACVAGTCVCALLRGPVHYAERLLTHDCTFRTVSGIRSRVFGALRQLAPAKVEGHDAGDLISLLTGDIELLEGFYSRALVPCASVALTALVCVVFAVFVSPLVAVVLALLFVLVGALVPSVALRATRERGAEMHAYSVLMTGFLLDSLKGMRDLLAFGRAQEYADELGEHRDSMASGESAHARNVAMLQAVPFMLSMVGCVVVACLGAQQVACGSLTFSWWVVLVAGCVASMQAPCSTAGLGTSFGPVLAAADRVLDVVEEQPAVVEAADSVSLDGFEGLDFAGVTFGYEPDTVAVDDATFSIEPGSFVGISGKSGVGKSTMLKLAMRFWDVREGAVRVNGVDVRDVRLTDLRELVSYMVQDTYLFKGTLRENLLVARADATDAQIEEALEKAALLDAVRQWPHGLDTVIGGGSTSGDRDRRAAGEQSGPAAEKDAAAASVSDGERQRIGLARAFLHDAPLFLLDEPTSNLDALNEAAVLRSLCQNAEGKTIVIVSHRRAVAAVVDKLLVVE